LVNVVALSVIGLVLHLCLKSLLEKETLVSPPSPKLRPFEGSVLLVGYNFSVGFSRLYCDPIRPMAIDNYLLALVIAIFVSIFSIFGDLFESYLKREAGVKDSGDLIPGHGGILDRIDGYMFAGVIFYIILKMADNGFTI